MYKAAALLLVLVFIAPVYADILASQNNTVFLVMDQGGGTANSTDQKVLLTIDYVVGNATSFTNNLCIGYICVLYGPQGQVLSVAFLLDTNLGAGSQGYVDTQGPGLYFSKQLSNYFSCVQNPALTDNPIFGIIYAGSNLQYVKLTNSLQEVSQDQPGNLFLVPVTSGGCSSIGSKMPLTYPVTPFVPLNDALNSIELAVSYPFDLVGDFTKTGKFTLTLEKNDTSIIGKPA